MRTSAVLLAALLALTVVRPIDGKGLQFSLNQSRLANGLSLIVVENHQAPVVSVALAYGVGSADEILGQTGLAHLFEHLMFRGTGEIPPGQYAKEIQAVGGTFNAATGRERTRFYATVPAPALSMVLKLEADRMASLAIAPNELANEQKVIVEEWQLFHQNRPYGIAEDDVDELALGTFEYRHPIIGYMQDLQAITPEQAAAFYRSYYQPANAAIAIVGDVETTEAQRLTKSYFARLRSSAPRVRVSSPAKVTRGRRQTVTDARARASRLYVTFVAPAGDSRDAAALRLFDSAWAQGEAAPLTRALIDESHVASSVFTALELRKNESAYYVVATVASGKTLQDCEAVFMDAVMRVKTHGVTADEIRRGRYRIQAEQNIMVERSSALANRLADAAVMYGDAEEVNTEIQHIDGLDTNELLRVANTVLITERATITHVVPKADMSQP